MKRPRGGAPRRRVERREPRRVIRVLTEGRNTEPSYLAQLQKRYPDSSVHLDIRDSGMTPLTLVRRAREYQKAESHSRSADRITDFEEVWCVFDVDEHPNVSQAINEAHQSGIGVVVSNPCFELWLVLHHRDQTAHIDRRAAQREARALGLIDERKRLVPHNVDALMNGYGEAVRRAQQLEQRHVGNGSDPNENPSSTVWRLTDKLS